MAFLASAINARAEMMPLLKDAGFRSLPISMPTARKRYAATDLDMTMVGKVSFCAALEGLRGFAVMLVLISHVVPAKEMLGTLGVGVFFVLSGFLITGVLQHHIERKPHSSDLSSQPPAISLSQQLHYLPRFYMDRFVRLTPALALMVAGIVYLCIQAGISSAQIMPDAFSAFFYLHNIYPADSSSFGMMIPGMFLNTWSLAVEEQFYIVWSILFSFIVALPQRKRATTMLWLVGASFLVRYVSGYTFMTSSMYGIDYRFSWTANVWKMFMGCAVRLIPVPKFTLRSRMGEVATFVLCVLVYMWGWGLLKLGFDYRTDGAWLELFTSLVVLQVILGSLSGNGFLEAQFFRYPGRISYSLYLWQFPLQAYYGWPLYDWMPTFLAFAVASFTTFFIEEPIRKAYRAQMSATKYL